MKIRQTKFGNMCEVRLKDRRIRVYRQLDRNWAIEFVRLSKACAGCREDHAVEHHTYTDRKKKTVMTGLKLSEEAMLAFCKAVATLLEFEQRGVEVKS